MTTLSRAVLLAVGLVICVVASAAMPAAPAPAQAPAAQPSPAQTPTMAMTADVSKLRDPFQPPAIVAGPATQLSPLEHFPVESLKLVGIMTGPDHLRAMVEGPDGKAYILSENSKVGIHDGRVRRITTDGVVVVEKSVDLLGHEQEVKSEIRFATAEKTEGL